MVINHFHPEVQVQSSNIVQWSLLLVLPVLLAAYSMYHVQQDGELRET